MYVVSLSGGWFDTLEKYETMCEMSIIIIVMGSFNAPLMTENADDGLF